MTADIRLGFLSGLAAYVIWGFLPLYFKFMGHIPADLMLAHRIAWSVPTGLVLVILARSSRKFFAQITWRRLGWLSLSACLIATNWMVYIWAVAQERVLEASLGYYINPLVNVVIGAIFLSERLSRRQWLAVAIAGLGVALIGSAFGHVPWVSLVLCFSFAFYSLIRKQVEIDSRTGFLIEAGLLAPLALMWLEYTSQSGTPVLGKGGWDVIWLGLSGPITAVPLICFALAAKRLKLSTIGMMQYIGPTLQFIIAIVLGEAFGWTHASAFCLIWLSLIIFSWDGLTQMRQIERKSSGA